MIGIALYSYATKRREEQDYGLEQFSLSNLGSDLAIRPSSSLLKTPSQRGAYDDLCLQEERRIYHARTFDDQDGYFRLVRRSNGYQHGLPLQTIRALVCEVSHNLDHDFRTLYSTTGRTSVP